MGCLSMIRFRIEGPISGGRIIGFDRFGSSVGWWGNPMVLVTWVSHLKQQVSVTSSVLRPQKVHKIGQLSGGPVLVPR